MGGTQAWAVIVAAGSGARFGSPKQFAPLGGREVLAWSLEVACRVCDGVVVVVPAADVAALEGALPGAVSVVAGGATRSESVRAGLRAVPDEVEVVLVHDAARPLASHQLWERVIQTVAEGASGAVPAILVTDTIRQVGDDGASTTLERASLRAVQTPQGFRLRALRAAHASGVDATDDAVLLEVAGEEVVLVEGEDTNFKITSPDDLPRAEVALARIRQEASR